MDLSRPGVVAPLRLQGSQLVGTDARVRALAVAAERREGPDLRTARDHSGGGAYDGAQWPRRKCHVPSGASAQCAGTQR